MYVVLFPNGITTFCGLLIYEIIIACFSGPLFEQTNFIAVVNVQRTKKKINVLFCVKYLLFATIKTCFKYTS